MGLRQRMKVGGHCMALAALCLFAAPALAVDVALAGVMGSKAMLMIDGRGPELLAVGQTVSGVKLISLQGDQVVVEIGGKKRPLRIGQHVAGPTAPTGDEKAVLTADGAGHFVTNGAVNGVSARLLVDTGATFVAIGASEAKRLGVDLSRGQVGVANTANGQTSVTVVKLNSVRVGDITLLDVDAAVHSNDLPIILLGMSFLNRVEMQRDGSTMTLKRRF